MMTLSLSKSSKGLNALSNCSVIGWLTICVDGNNWTLSPIKRPVSIHWKPQHWLCCETDIGLYSSDTVQCFEEKAEIFFSIQKMEFLTLVLRLKIKKQLPLCFHIAQATTSEASELSFSRGKFSEPCKWFYSIAAFFLLFCFAFRHLALAAKTDWQLLVVLTATVRKASLELPFL